MTRRQLESVHYLRKELRKWQEMQEDLRADIALSPKVMDGMPYLKTNAKSNPTEDKAIKLAEVSKVIDGKISEIGITLSNIVDYISGIQDSEMRIIISMRCVQLKTWEEIGDYIGFDRTTIAKKYQRFMDEQFESA